ncbi:MAG: DUF4810 domain-containing protein [Treponema sp.]|nr:DUF4810 domain-containing protein [Treponema sp.]
MKLHLLTLGAVLALASCTSTQYGWYDYQEDYYRYVKFADEKSAKELTKTYEKIIKRQGGARKIVPPGIYADYGWLLAENGKTSQAKEMFLKEIEYYPESSVFISNILKRLDNEKTDQ